MDFALGNLCLLGASAATQIVEGQPLNFAICLRDVFLKERRRWLLKLMFLIGVVYSQSLVFINQEGSTYFESDAEFLKGIGYTRLILSGIFTGIGLSFSRIGLFDHVLGYPRASPSLIGPRYAIIILVGIITYNVLPDDFNDPSLLSSTSFISAQEETISIIVSVCNALLVAMVLYTLLKVEPEQYASTFSESFLWITSGVLAGVGLSLTGLTMKKTAASAIKITAGTTTEVIFWNPSFLVTLVLLFIGRIIIGVILKKLEHPLMSPSFAETPELSTKLDKEGIINCVLVGIGWGFSGLDIAAMFCNIAIHTKLVILFYLLPLIVAHYAFGFILARRPKAPPLSSKGKILQMMGKY